MEEKEVGDSNESAKLPFLAVSSALRADSENYLTCVLLCFC